MASRYTGFTMVLLAIFIVLGIVGLAIVMPRGSIFKDSIVNNAQSYEYKMGNNKDSQHLAWQLDQITDQLHHVRLNQILIGQRLYIIEKFLVNTREIKPESLTFD